MATGNDLTKTLTGCLKELHLPTVRECYEGEAERARRESLSFERYLLNLMEREQEVRRQNRIARLLHQSKLPLDKTLQTFDRSRLPRKVGAHVDVLLDGAFLDRAENVLAFGNPGSGKTHLLCAIGQALIHHDRRVLFMPCSLLVQELLIAKRELTLARALKRLAKYDALIIDDIGYVQQNREEMEVLFALLADRYERRSVLITSNLPFSLWERIFKDPMTTAAAIDRLVHHSIILFYSAKRLRSTRNSICPATGSSSPSGTKKNDPCAECTKYDRSRKTECGCETANRPGSLSPAANHSRPRDWGSTFDSTTPSGIIRHWRSGLRRRCPLVGTDGRRPLPSPPMGADRKGG